jgi:hypothetical protein
MKLFGVIIALGAIVAFCIMYGAQFFKGLFAWGMSFELVAIFIIVGLIALVAAMVLESVGAGVVTVIAALAIIGVGIVTPYNNARQYVASTNVVEEDVPSFDGRAPYRVASLSARSNLQDATGEAQATKSLAGEGDTGQWNTLVQKRGWFQGYESAQSIETPLYGSVKSKDVQLCEFNPNAKLRFGGSVPSNNLSRAILGSTPLNVNFSKSDVYSYCDGDTPKVVTPLKKISGFPFASWTAYGVAEYDGKTNQVTIYTDADDIAEIPGPVYPATLAEDTREGYKAVGGFLPYIQGQGSAGYEDTSDDAEDPNSGNNTEFSLRAEDGNDVFYVTPLTPRGNSVSITGLATVDNRTITSGERNPVTIYKLSGDEARKSNSSVADGIKTTYSWLPDWASGLEIFEIVPGADGTWTASIGRNQSVAYRATVDSDGTAVLYDSSGNELTRTSGNDEGNDEGETTDTPAAPADSDLTTLTPAQLRELAGRVLDELEQRAATAPAK